MSRTLPLLLLLAATATAADWSDVKPSMFEPDSPEAKAFPKMVSAEQRKRMQEANERESKLFVAIKTKAEWEKYRDERIGKLRESLGTFPAVPKNMKVVTTKTIDGDGFVIRNTLYESRPGWWVAANLYLPAKPPENMPGIVIAHSHHGGKTGGELQDMGMTWARAGVAVLVPDQHGYGERRQHDFNSDKDYPKPFKVGRQDYFFRYMSNLQLSAVGDSLMGWMAWDLMRGVDVLLQQPTIDANRIILMGSVAGGGDPAGVTAALDDRIACVVPFNFGGWQPESSVLENPDRDFDWFGDGYWESTRGLRGGAAGGFAHFVIVGSVAPRKVLYSHEFAWDAKTDPAWPRLQKVFDFYDAKDSLRVAHGAGTVRASGSGNTHCNHIGAEHRKMIHPALKDWFGIPIPTEYSKPLPSSDLKCWTDDARKELKPKTLTEVLAGSGRADRREPAVDDWKKLLGDTNPVKEPVLRAGMAEQVTGGKLIRFALTTDPGITVPMMLITPDNAEGKTPAVVMVASGGKAGFLKERGEALTELLKAGVAVCLVDVRGTGETRPGTSADRGSSRTSLSQQSLILGQPMLGAQLRDLRTVLKWLAAHDGIDGKRLAVWGDSFAKMNAKDTLVAVPLDVEGPAISEPRGANLALLAGLFEANVKVIYARGGIDPTDTLTGSPYLWLPHDAVVPGPTPMGSLAPMLARAKAVKYEATVDVHNKATGDKALSVADAAKWLAEKLK
jgi:cephalosporin-C deacetylase-like acetyl esterase